MLTQLNSKLSKHIQVLVSLWRKKKDASPLSKKELNIVSQSLLSLQRGLTGNRELAGAGYMDNTSFLGSYLLYYWPVSYMQVSYEANAIKPFIKKDSFRILDIGSGPAPASAALCDTFPVQSVTLVDSSRKALDLAECIFRSEWTDCDLLTFQDDFENSDLSFLKEKYDIIVLSHSLNELWKGQKKAIEQRKDFLLKLFEFLANDGILLVSEPALLETSRNLILVRDMLIQDNINVVSPCLCSCSCPISKSGTNQTCHADINWKPIEPVASIAQLAKLDRQSVKMIYMAFAKNPNLVKDAGDNQYRIVSEGMLNKSGRIRYLLCNGKERIPFSARKDDAIAKEMGFFALKRYDFVTLKTPELRGDSNAKAYGVDSGTKLDVRKFTEPYS